jgi:hypothetical protein
VPSEKQSQESLPKEPLLRDSFALQRRKPEVQKIEAS